MRKAVGRRDVAFLAGLEDLEARRHLASVQSASLDAHLVGCACGSCAPYRELPQTQLPPQPPAAEGKAAKGSFKNKDFSQTLALDVTPTALITPTAAQTYAGPLSGKIVYVSGGHGYHWTGTGTTWTTGRSEINEMIEDLGNQDQMAAYADYLLRAGATVVPMRPIGHQLTEFVLDNDSPGVTFSAGWSNSSATTAFFGTAGDVPYRFATVNVNATATATYAPTFSAAQAGFYPVYAWTRDGTDRAIDQTYRINHAGGTAEVKVNHQLVGEGWIYLGTYYFAAGSSGNVQIINKSIQADSSVPATFDANNVVIADAIRFGNGMGSVTRNGVVSGRSREDEAALYWLEAANGVGVDFSQFRGGLADEDGANVGAPARYARYMNNAPLGQALYMGFHSNAGTGSNRGTIGLYNSSANSTPNQFRWAFLSANEVNDDLVSIGVAGGLEAAWSNRADSALTLDRSDIDFGEISDNANGDEFDATILEVAFHDNVTDAQLMRDPKVREWVGRSTYQATVRYFNEFGGTAVAFAPAAPTAPRAVSQANGNLMLSWTAPVSNAANGQAAASYTVMMSRDGYSFGVLATGITGTSHTINAADLDGNAYYFRIVANNAGGQSPGSVVVGGRKNGAGGGGTGVNRILVVNGFDRLERSQNFRQTLIGGAVVDRVRPRFSNSFDYVVQAGEAIEAYRAATGVALGFDSAQNEHVINGQVNLASYRAVIWLSGEESTDHETFGAAEQTIVSSYLAGGGRLFVTGAEVGWDLDRNPGESSPDPSTADRDFYEDVLRSNYVADDSGTYALTLTGAPATSIFAGLSNFSFDNGALFYNAEFPDRLGAINGSTVALNYSGGTGGAAALQWSDVASGARVVSFGFPFETITTAANRTNVMTRVLDFFQAAVSATPQIADLDPGSDSGTSTTDNITRRNNAGAANNLTFMVPGTVPGATVRVFADGLLIGQDVAAAGTTSTTVATNGSVTLLDGTRNITATQEEPGKSESAVSAALSVLVDTAAPVLSSVFIGSSAWLPDFSTAVGSVNGYAIPTGESQLKTLPWINLNRVVLEFNEDVSVQQADLQLHSSATQSTLAWSGFTYNGAARTGTWSLGAFLTADKLRLRLDGTTGAAVTDVAGNVIDGDWADSSDTFPSGNGAAGGDFALRFNVVPGDVNQNTIVQSSDALPIQAALLTTPGTTGYAVFKDVNGNGILQSNDFLNVQSRLLNTLPAAEPGGEVMEAGQTDFVLASNGGSVEPMFGENVVWGEDVLESELVVLTR